MSPIVTTMSAPAGRSRRVRGPSGGSLWANFTPNLPAGLTLYRDSAMGNFPSNAGQNPSNLAFFGRKIADNGPVPNIGDTVDGEVVTVNSALWRNITDTSAPYGSGCTDMVYPEGNGNGANNVSLATPAGAVPWVRYYIALAIKMSENYVWHSEVEKFLYPSVMTPGFANQRTNIGWNPIGSEGPNTATTSWSVNTQVNEGPLELWSREQNTSNTARIRKGQWQLVEIYLQLSTPGNLDAIAKVWVDGQLAMDEANFKTTPSTYTAQSTLLSAGFAGTRGGGTSTVPVPPGGIFRRFNRMAVYGSTTY